VVAAVRRRLEEIPLMVVPAARFRLVDMYAPDQGLACAEARAMTLREAVREARARSEGG
jgi:hypothetical protein